MPSYACQNVCLNDSKNQTIAEKPKLIIRRTNLEVPFKVKTDNFQILSKILIFDSSRNSQIVADIKAEANKGSAIYDYRDIKVEYLEKFFKKRKKYYRENFMLEL